MKKFIFGVLALASLCILSSCEKKATGDAAYFVGQWKLYSVSVMGGEPMTLEQIMADPKYKAYAQYFDQAVAQLNDDYTFAAVMPADGETKEGKWSYNGSKKTITFKADKVTVEAETRDGAICFDYDFKLGAFSVPFNLTYKKK